MKLYGLLITKDDHAIFADWCRDQLPFYDAVTCLDGSGTDQTARLARVAEMRTQLIKIRDPSSLRSLLFAVPLCGPRPSSPGHQAGSFASSPPFRGSKRLTAASVVR